MVLGVAGLYVCCLRFKTWSFTVIGDLFTALGGRVRKRGMILFGLGGAALLVSILFAVAYFFTRPTQARRIAKLTSPPSVADIHVLALVNPISGRRRGVQDWDEIATMLRSRGFVVRTAVTQHSGHAKELMLGLASQQQQPDILAIVGGDGFVYEVLNATGSVPSAALAIVPSGTGNGIATSLGIRTPLEAAEALLRGATKPLDLMRVTRAVQPAADGPTHGPTTVAALSVAWGAIADHDALVERELRRMPGKLLLVPAYIILAARKYRGRVSFTPHSRQGPLPSTTPHTRDAASGDIHIDGEFNLVQVCNLPWIATDVCAAPGATPDGGCFGILIMRGASRLDLVRMFLAAESGTHTAHAAVELYWATRATIVPADGPFGLGNLAVDGELLPPSRVDIQCEPSAVRQVVHRMG